MKRCSTTNHACSYAYKYLKCKCIQCKEYKRTCEKPKIRNARNYRWKKLHPEFRSFEAMKKRCNNKNSEHYPRYGGRGIKVLLTSWHDIVDAIGPWPGKGYSIDRIDNDGYYEASNIRWATMLEQNRNRNNKNRRRRVYTN